MDAATTLVYDGDCGFCTTAVSLVPRLGLRADRVVAWQLADLDALGVTREQAAGAVQWVDADGVAAGHRAVARLLMASGPLWWPLGRLLLLPGISAVAARVYALVADNRMRLPGGTPACAPRPPVDGAA